MDRPYMSATVDELEEMFRKHRGQRVVLRRLLDELDFRHTDRAKQLRKEIDGILRGVVPMPQKQLRAARPGDQIPLIRD